MASSLNRRWIGVDNSPEAINTILKRFARGLEPMGDYVTMSQHTQLSFPDWLREKAITDFALYALEADDPYLAEILTEWAY